MLEHGLLGGETGASLWLALLGILFISYLLGGVNSAILVSRIGYHDDIRKYGSKNAGLTNVLRVYGKKAAAVTLAGDIAKTLLACFIGSIFLGQTGAYIAGCGAVIGHIWPVYFNFKGGKGVLAFAAAALYCNATVFLIMITIFFIIVAFTKYISLGSVMCALIYPLILSRFIGTNNAVIIPVLVVSVIIAVKHWGNIKRLRDGTENKIHLGKDGKYLPNWLLITVSAVLVVACVGTLFYQMLYKSGGFDRGTDAVSSGDTVISRMELRIMFIQEKNAYFGDGEQNEEHDGEIMELTLQKARRYVILNRAASDAGYAISDKAEQYLNNYIDSSLSLLDGWVDGDTADSYVYRVYGSGAKKGDLLAVVRAGLYADEYAASIGEDACNSLIAGASCETNDKAVRYIVNKY